MKEARKPWAQVPVDIDEDRGIVSSESDVGEDVLSSDGDREESDVDRDTVSSDEDVETDENVVDGESSLADTSNSEEDEVPARPVRSIRPKSVLSYEKLGGRPVFKSVSGGKVEKIDGQVHIAQ